MNPFFNTFTYRIIYIIITITLHKRTQSIQKTSVKEIEQFSNEKVNFCSFLARGLGVKVKGRVEKQDCNEQ